MKIVSYKNSTPDPDMNTKHTKNGYVYAIGVDGKTKIGSTKNPKERIAELRRFVGIFETSHDCLVVQTAEFRRTERECHKKLSDKRISGEWFNVTFDEAVSVILETSVSPDNPTQQQIDAADAEMKRKFEAAKKLMSPSLTATAPQFYSPDDPFYSEIGGGAREYINAAMMQAGEPNALNEAVFNTGCPAQLIIFSNNLIFRVWPDGYKQFSSLQEAEADHEREKQMSVESGEYPADAFGSFDDFCIDLRKPELKLIGGTK